MRALQLLLVSACLIVLPGCGTIKHTPAIHVSNLTSAEKVKPDNQFDPKQLANAAEVLSSFTIVDKKGNEVHLTDSKRPILFEAYWCPHCQRTLILFHNTPAIMNAKPIVISTGFPANTTLQEAVAASKKEFDLLGVSGFTVYYALGNVHVPSYPTLLFHQNQSTDLLSGEHTKQVWEQAMQVNKR